LQPAADRVISEELNLKRLYHELQVHQIELEMQHSELQQSQQTLDLLLEQHTLLFDFSPIGYLTLDSEGYILKCNMIGAGLLGLARSEIIGLPFERFITKADRPLLDPFLKKIFRERPLETNSELRIVRGALAGIRVQLKAQIGATAQECLVAIVEVGKGDGLAKARFLRNVLN